MFCESTAGAPIQIGTEPSFAKQTPTYCGLAISPIQTEHCFSDNDSDNDSASAASEHAEHTGNELNTEEDGNSASSEFVLVAVDGEEEWEEVEARTSPQWPDDD